MHKTALKLDGGSVSSTTLTLKPNGGSISSTTLALKPDGGSISSTTLTKMKSDVWVEQLISPRKCLSDRT